MIKFLLDIVFPKFCCGCNRLGTYLCPMCYSKLYFFPTTIEMEVEKPYCDQLFALVKYQKTINQLMFDFKYHGVKEIGQTCARMLFYCGDIPDFDLVINVPLHSAKLQQRGFNQTEIIAREYAKLVNKPYFQLLKKIKNNKAQANISDQQQRLANTIGVYQLVKSLPKDIDLVNSCLSIDDVSTTGATINECAKVLKSLGIKTVYGLTFAHG